MLRALLTTLLSIILIAPVHAKPFEELFPDLVSQLSPEQLALLDGMDYQTGTVTVGDNLASFELGDQFYFLNSVDANYVLTDLWGNPPFEGTLGMIFPIDQTPMHDTWGIEISYEDIG